jgi:hypothetical protein
MARVASCPQCNHEILIVEDAHEGAWAKCPECRAFFQLRDAASRQIQPALIVDDDSSDPNEETMVVDETALAWSSPHDETRRTYSTASSPTVSDVPPLQHASEQEAPKIESQAEVEPTEAPRVGLEDSAERIDKWFRSAKTIVEVSHPTGEPDGQGRPDLMPSASLIDQHPQTEQTAQDDDELQVEHAAVLPENSAPWDDSARMERLLADIEDQPSDGATLTPEPAAAGDRAYVEAITQRVAEPAVTVVRPVSSIKRRRKSAIWSLMATAVAGIIGLALGYYALLWIAGASGDFLKVAHYLPAAILPAELQSARPETVVDAPSTARDELAARDVGTDVTESAEVQAGYSAPADTGSATIPADGSAPGASETTPLGASEPSQFDDPGAAPMIEAAGKKGASIAGAPSFNADELAVSLQAAKDAQPGLVTGDLADVEVQRAKGFSYSLLCDLAQKLAFVDAAVRSDYAKPLADDAEELFRKTLADAHTRGEVARIVPKWIASPHRKHGGVFFAGTLSREVDKGTVVECQFDVGGELQLTVLVPPEIAQLLADPAQPMGIVGWIVDKPAGKVAGYTGDAPQAVWASHLIPLP